MRFLMFNLVVAAALVYLLRDGGMPERVLQSVAMVKDGVHSLAAEPAPAADAKAASVSSTPAATETAAAPPPAGPAPAAPKATPPAAPAVSASLTPRPEDLLPTDDPAVRQRRAEVLGTAGPEAAPATMAADPAFMAPQLRRRELQVLSEEMELLFSELISR